MQVTDGEKFRNIIRGMSRMYGTEPDGLVLDAYWIALNDWAFEDFQSAAQLLMKTRKFMPRPSEFEDLRKAGRETAGEVFAGLRQWLRYSPSGYTLKPETPRSIASAFSAMGGAQAYAMCDAAKLPFLERRFCDHYEEISGADDTREVVPQIAYGDAALELTSHAGTFKSVGARLPAPEKSS
jgi:hypothetical protein